MEPPVEQIDQRYTLDQVRFNAPLRDRMPRVDLDITFETGSWQLSPEQVDRLAAIAEGINRGDPAQSRARCSWSRAIPTRSAPMSTTCRCRTGAPRRSRSRSPSSSRCRPENLVTQGYGEQYLKVPTPGPERANRRVAMRRITPLIDQQAQNAPPPR